MPSNSILVDSSAWIDYLNQACPPLHEYRATGADIAYSEPILMEVLAGARNDDEWTAIRNIVTNSRLLKIDTAADFQGAAWIHGLGRSKGLTVGLMDCLILAVARAHKALLLTGDRKQARLGEVLGINVQLTS